MARIIAGVTTSHVPAIGAALDNGRADEPYWRRVFDGYVVSKAWLAKTRPDVVILVDNDHASAFSLELIPTFAIGCADEFPPADEGWGPRPVPACVNVIQYPPPTGHRCYMFGKAIRFLDKFGPEPEELVSISHLEYVREAGSEAIEMVMWLIARGALDDHVKELHRFYTVPASNTAVGHLVLENVDP